MTRTAVAKNDNVIPVTAAIGLGGNLSSAEGRPEATLTAALTRLAAVPGLRLRAVSRFFRTPAFPPGSGPDYVNAAALVDTTLAPEALLAALHAIESDLGRERTTRWAARVVDLDLLVAGDAILPSAAEQARWRALPSEDQRRATPTTLILPHPRLQDRGFVLIPLLDIAPGLRVPGLDRTVAELARALPETDRAAIRPLD